MTREELETIANLEKVFADHRAVTIERNALRLENLDLKRLIVTLDTALSGERLVGSDQNPMGWRDLLGAAASKIRTQRNRP